MRISDFLNDLRVTLITAEGFKGVLAYRSLYLAVISGAGGCQASQYSLGNISKNGLGELFLSTRQLGVYMYALSDSRCHAQTPLVAIFGGIFMSRSSRKTIL